MKKLILMLFISISCTVTTSSIAQSLNHPMIWVTTEERPQILENIKKYDWAKSIVNQLHERVDGPLKKHQVDPNAILNAIPDFAKNDHENSEQKAGPLAAGHNKVLALASEAGMLYYITEEVKYAQFAADILAFYIDHISPLTPQTTTICGYDFFDPRTTYGPFALTYDFIYNYLQNSNATTYNKTTGTREAFNNAKAQKAIANIVGNVLQEFGKPDEHGKTISNHPILTASGALFGILCVENDKERQRLFDVFWEKGTAHQNSFKNTILPMFGEQGIWPESTSYSFMPMITMVLNIVDRVYPEMNVTKDYHNIFEGNFLFDYLRYPNRKFVRFGDSKRNNDGTEDLYRYTLSIADRRGYVNLKQQAQLALKQAYEAKGGYEPRLNDGIFNNFQPLDLIWGLPIPDKIEGGINFDKPTVIVKHAGIALQRNYVKKDNEMYGLCGIIGGAHYVHSHVTGISMELYGAGYVMAPNAGLPKTVHERRIPLHENYFRLYAGNNTVVVNGTSHGIQPGSWKDGAYVWQNKTVNIASEPKHLAPPISEHFNFATQFLNDEVNHAKQERTLSIIRTSEKTAYYVDVFRSKSLGINKFHDYIYHNIGDNTILKNSNGEVLEVKTTNRYQNDIGDPVQSPGWRYFENTQVTKPTNQAVHISFQVKEDNRYMHMFVPEGVEREYTKALAPPTREAKNGYVDKKTQVLAIKQKGEAWDRPFIAILEPSTNNKATVQSVEPLLYNNKIVGTKVLCKVKDHLITDYIISQDNTNELYFDKKLDVKFKGRFGVVRIDKVGKKETISLYIGDGKQLDFKSYHITSDTENKGFKLFD